MSAALPLARLAGLAPLLLDGVAAASISSSGAVDVFEQEDGYCLLMDVPGCKETQLKLELFDQAPAVLVVSGTSTEEVPAGAVWLRRERLHAGGSFQRAFALPASVDPDRVAASLDKGVLRISLPKRKEAQGKKLRQRRVHVSKL